MILKRLALAIALVAAPTCAAAQDETLADIRVQLSSLYAEVQALRGELVSTLPATPGPAAGDTPLDRLNTIEAELQRLTAKTEELEFRVNRITVDGTNRIGDLEWRLCELEEGCDVGLLGETPSLGGVDNGAGVPAPSPAPVAGSGGGAELAIGETQALEEGRRALATGDYETARALLADFNGNYPGSPLATEADFLRGAALEGLGQMTDAARAYLSAFSADPIGPRAPASLYKLGASLGAIGQTQDACLTLAEVDVRFPGDPAVLDAQLEMQRLNCQ